MRKFDLELIICLNIFFEREKESFNLWRPLLMIALYHQTKTPIRFWCRWGLNSRSLIQPSETLLVELIETHMFKHMFKYIYNNKIANIIISTTME